MEDAQRYRTVIDRLVESCQTGQGQIGARRAREGVWNANADAPDGPLADQWRANQLLAGLEATQRDALAELLVGAFEAGVHETLVVLHEEGVEPFDEGYEGAPVNDFVGRLQGWAWPESSGESDS